MDRLRPRLEAWLREKLAAPALTVRGLHPFSGGASNITARIDLEGGPSERLVLRMERRDGILAPYDVLREGRVLRALGEAPFPVPAVVAEEADERPLGRRFLILEYVPARHLGEPGVDADFGTFVQTVAQIHSLDWRAQGLEFLGVPEDAAAALERDLDVVAARARRFGCADDPALREAELRLRETVPTGGRLAFCQGDINVFNYLFAKGRLAAVVDWEEARIGDPRCDVGQLVALAHLKGAPFGPPRELGFVGAYEACIGSELPGLEWFRALWLFHLGVIYHGWVRFNDSSPWFTREEVDALLELALAELASPGN